MHATYDEQSIRGVLTIFGGLFTPKLSGSELLYLHLFSVLLLCLKKTLKKEKNAQGQQQEG